MRIEHRDSMIPAMVPSSHTTCQRLLCLGCQMHCSMMKGALVIGLAAVTSVAGFAPCTPAFRTYGLQQISTAVPASSARMSMSSNFGRNGGFNKGPKSVIRNIFKGPKSGNNKNSGGGLNGGDNNNKPPSGPLSSSSSSDDGKEKAEGFFKELWSNYNNNLESNPILTKALTSLTGFALGDFLAQKFIDKKDELDLQRLARMASFGLLIHGPTGHYFYGWLDSKIKSNGAAAVASKVFIDQVLWNPIFGTLFFGYMGAAEGLGLSAIKSRIENNLWSSVKGSWTVWPVAHAINFRYIPTSQRLLYINSIQIGYNMFLSVLGQRANSVGDKVSHKIEKGAKKAKSKARRI